MIYSSEQLTAALASVASAKRYVLAYSGGCDSQVLLHSLVKLELDVEILAVHIDHGLQKPSAEWARQCLDWAAALAVPCQVINVTAQHQRGESPEEAARKARYSALFSLLQPGDVLLTAHHCDDQAETLLLQLLRGSGSLGLSAMAQVTPLEQGTLLRPLLSVTRQALENYARSHNLPWIEDPSNQSLVYDRNFLRHEITPRLAERWPSWQRVMGRAAAHQAEMALLADDLASADYQVVLKPGAQTLLIDRVLALADYRQRNVLRFWLRQLGLALPTAQQLRHIQTDVLKAGENRMPLVKWSGVEVRRYRNDLYAMFPLAVHDIHSRLIWCTRSQPMVVTPTGDVSVETLLQMGFKRDELDKAPLELRYRCGNERVRLKMAGIHHDLKNLFQQAGIPAWQRDKIPLIYQCDRLIAVLGYWRADAL